MKLQFDFAAQAGKHFGIIRPLDDLVLDLPNAVDVWSPVNTASSLALVDGRVSEWRGRKNNRILGQAIAARRPVPEAGLLRLSSPTMLPMAQLELAGAAIGQRAALSIAVHARIHPEMINTDNQYLWGSNAPVFRLAYRYTSGNRYLRVQAGGTGASNNLDVALPADWSGVIGALVTVENGRVTLTLSNGNTGSIPLPSPAELGAFVVGHAASGNAGSLQGFVGNFGIWTQAFPDADRARLIRWAT